MYNKARNIFKRIKERFEDKKFKGNVMEFQEAIKKLVSEYDTANWENRFVVGGALEVLFCVLINSLDFKCKWLKEARYDIEIEGIKFSIKSNFVGSGDIRLINVLGKERVSWEEPTLFFISNFGLCYLDPEMESKTKYTGDAITINVREIKDQIKTMSEYLIKIDIPRKPIKSRNIKTASYDVAKIILEEIESKYLKPYMF